MPFPEQLSPAFFPVSLKLELTVWLDWLASELPGAPRILLSLLPSPRTGTQDLAFSVDAES